MGCLGQAQAEQGVQGGGGRDSESRERRGGSRETWCPERLVWSPVLADLVSTGDTGPQETQGRSVAVTKDINWGLKTTGVHLLTIWRSEGGNPGGQGRAPPGASRAGPFPECPNPWLVPTSLSLCSVATSHPLTRPLPLLEAFQAHWGDPG